MRIKTRHRIIYALLYPIVKPLFCILFNLRTERFKPQDKNDKNKAYLILANHQSALDPVFVALSFKKPIYYVTSDHVFRKGFLSSLLVYFFAPIPKLKATLDISTIKEILSVTREGGMVGIFPEGNRSFNGAPFPIPESTGKLVKRLVVPLILYRIEGGYMSNPRWGRKMRRGLITGRCVREVSTDELSAMSVDEINDLIVKTLYINDYEFQRSRLIKYKGKRRAEHIESILYLCPNCHGIGSIKSRSNRFRCACGLDAAVNVYGFIENAPFETVLDWDNWQKEYLKVNLPNMINKSGGNELIGDGNMSLYSVTRALKTQLVDTGRLALYPDKLVFSGKNKNYEFGLSEISRLIIHGRQAMQFATAGGDFYELKCLSPMSAVKYCDFFDILKDIQAKRSD
ncbi:MAG TPA: lysophospholipid acyltransferase family protein [Clostridia bacterium]|nr:lysophospholipid acyltransferase family protein [Clostridia bacterium]